MNSSHKLKRALGLTLLLAALLSAACRGGNGSDADAVAPASPTPIAECQAYENALSTCIHRPVGVGFSTQASLLPHSEGERARIASMCTENLHRLAGACR